MPSFREDVEWRRECMLQSAWGRRRWRHCTQMRSEGADLEADTQSVYFLLLLRTSLQVARIGKKGAIFAHQAILRLLDINLISNLT